MPDAKTIESYRPTHRTGGEGLHRCDGLFIARLYHRLTGDVPTAGANALRFKLYKLLSYDEVRTVLDGYLLCHSSDRIAQNYHNEHE